MSKKTKPCELLWETKLNVTHQKKATPKLAWLLGWLHSCTHQHYMVYKSDFLPKKVFLAILCTPPSGRCASHFIHNQNKPKAFCHHYIITRRPPKGNTACLENMPGMGDQYGNTLPPAKALVLATVSVTP